MTATQTSPDAADLAALRSATSALLAGHAGGTWCFEDPSPGAAQALWAEATTMELPLIGVGEERGGAGGGVDELVVVMEQIGRWLAPGPFLGAGIYAAALSFDHGSQLPSLADGAPVGPAISIASSATETVPALFGAPTGEWVLRVGPAEVDLSRATTSVEWTSSTFDPSLPLLVPGGQIQQVAAISGEAARETWQTARLLLAATAVGISARVLEITVDYAKTRHQFGQAIGAFQAVKHRCSNMAIREQAARACVDHALSLAGGGDPAEYATAVEVAAELATEYAVENAEACLETHGAMGFTWEFVGHRYLKRAHVLRALATA